MEGPKELPVAKAGNTGSGPEAATGSASGGAGAPAVEEAGLDWWP